MAQTECMIGLGEGRHVCVCVCMFCRVENARVSATLVEKEKDLQIATDNLQVCMRSCVCVCVCV